MKIYISFPEGKAKALTMSYDDGKIQDERLVSIFNKYGIRGTFNLNYGMMDKEGLVPPRIPKDRIGSLYKGHEIATHTMTHPTIARCPMTAVAREILEDRSGLEQITGTIIRGHAYPNGSYNEEIKQLFHQLGIAYARVVEPVADFALPTDPMEWHPTCHHDAQDLMENFCSYMGGRDDIWYATNIEIIDYMEAAKSLRFSADNSLVYNPSAQTVWLQIDGSHNVAVPGGTLIRLDAPMK